MQKIAAIHVTKMPNISLVYTDTCRWLDSIRYNKIPFCLKFSWEIYLCENLQYEINLRSRYMVTLQIVQQLEIHIYFMDTFSHKISSDKISAPRTKHVLVWSGHKGRWGLI